MNTNEVAKLLGVSSSTIQRWVKQLELPMDRNERGHYSFKSDDIDLLKEIQDQIQSGSLLQDITPVRENLKPRKGVIKSVGNDKSFEKLVAKVSELEISLNAKADSVASYQLLQHRREIEDLQDQVKDLTQQLELLQTQINELKKPAQIEKPLVLDHGKVKRKKKNIVSSLFGF